MTAVPFTPFSDTFSAVRAQSLAERARAEQAFYEMHGVQWSLKATLNALLPESVTARVAAMRAMLSGLTHGSLAGSASHA